MSFFSDFFGDNDLANIDTSIDNLINNLPEVQRFTRSDNISGEFIDEFMKDAPQLEIEKLLDSISVSRERLQRYSVYDEAYKYVPIIKRIMVVYIANILQKNPVTGKCLLIREHEKIGKKEIESDTLDKAKKLASDCIEYFDLIVKLRKKILPNQLKYGDCYCEIIDLAAEGKKKVDANAPVVNNVLSSAPLFEAEMRNINLTLDQINYKKQNEKQNGNYIDPLLEKISEYLVEVQDQPIKALKSGNDVDDEVNYDNILMKIHRPHKIIVLETDFGSLLGYLVVSKEEVPQTYNLTQSLSTLVGRITSLTTNEKTQNAIVDRLVRYMLKTILEKTKKSGKISSDVSIDSLLSGLPADVSYYLKRLVVEQEIGQKDSTFNRVKVRFVPADRMLSFTTSSSDYDPYGQSFIDSLVFPCKLYILSQLSNVIIKLSRAAPVRKFICAQ